MVLKKVEECFEEEKDGLKNVNLKKVENGLEESVIYSHDVCWRWA